MPTRLLCACSAHTWWNIDFKLEKATLKGEAGSATCREGWASKWCMFCFRQARPGQTTKDHSHKVDEQGVSLRSRR